MNLCSPGRLCKTDVLIGSDDNGGPIRIMISEGSFVRTEAFNGAFVHYTSKPHVSIHMQDKGDSEPKYVSFEEFKARFLEEAESDNSLVNFNTDLTRVPRLLSIEYERITESNEPLSLEYANKIKNEIEGTKIIEVGYYHHNEYTITSYIIDNLNRLTGNNLGVNHEK